MRHKNRTMLTLLPNVALAEDNNNEKNSQRTSTDTSDQRTVVAMNDDGERTTKENCERVENSPESEARERRYCTERKISKLPVSNSLSFIKASVLLFIVIRFISSQIITFWQKSRSIQIKTRMLSNQWQSISGTVRTNIFARYTLVCSSRASPARKRVANFDYQIRRWKWSQFKFLIFFLTEITFS